MFKSSLHCIGIGLVIVFGSSCVSVERYNKKREQPVAVRKLQKDINYVQRKLYKRHPDYDYYTPKPVLDAQFDSLRRTIDTPLTMNEFYVRISKVVANVHQGHMVMLPAARKENRERKKALKNMGPAPLSQFDYAWENNKLYVIKHRNEDKSIKNGWELLSINNVPVQFLYEKYFATLTSDGYNTTALPIIFAKRVPTFYSEELGPVDSAVFRFHTGDSIVDKVVLRKEKKESSKLKAAEDTLKLNTVLEMAVANTNTDSLKRVDAQKEKQEKALRALHGYDEAQGAYIRELKFMGTDSNVAYLRIRQFMEGPYQRSYKAIFDSIEAAGSKVLVIDLRNNPGGRAAEVVELFRYFSDTTFTTYTKAKVGNKTSLLSPGFYRASPKLLWPFLSVYYPFYAGHRFFTTHKGKDGYYYYTGMTGYKPKSPHENRFKGKVYILINGGSFSASCLFSSRMKTLPQVTFVGEETGGDFNGTVAGTLPTVTLPKTKIIWRMGLMHIRPINRTEVKGRGIQPDITIVEKAADLAAGRDKIMEWVMERVSAYSYTEEGPLDDTNFE